MPSPPRRSTWPKSEVRSFFGWAVVLSIALHVLFLPLFKSFRPPAQPKEVAQRVTIERPIPLATPKPTPVPTPPPPTPKPTAPPTPPPPATPHPQTPPPVRSTPPPATPPPPQTRLHVDPPKTHSRAPSPTEPRANAAPGTEQGNPHGTKASGPPAVPVAPPASTAPPAPPVPTVAACKVPSADAHVTNAVEAEMPEIAKQQGASGTVEVKVTLTPSGAVAAVAIFKSSGNVALDQSAETAAKSSSYVPQIVDCKPVGGSYRFRVDFTTE